MASVWLEDKDEWGLWVGETMVDRQLWPNPQGVIFIQASQLQSAPYRGQWVPTYMDGRLTQAAMFYAPTPPEGEVWEFVDYYVGIDANVNWVHKDSNTTCGQVFVVPNNAA